MKSPPSTGQNPEPNSQNTMCADAKMEDHHQSTMLQTTSDHLGAQSHARGDDEATTVSSDAPSLPTHLLAEVPEHEQGSNKTQIKLFAKVALPIIGTQILQLLLSTENAVFVGKRFGSTTLAGASMGVLIGNLGGWSILMGTLSAFDTLAPQAMGAGNYAEVGLLAQRGLFCAMIVSGFCWAFWWNATPLLLAAGQPPQAVAIAARYLRILPLAMPALVVFQVSRRFLACQGITWPYIPINMLMVFVIHPLGLYSYVIALGWGFDGVPCAFVTTMWSQCVCSILFIRLRQPHQPGTWNGLRIEALHPSELCKFVRLALPGILSMSEWWFWEAVCFIAGLFGEDSLAAHTVAYNIVPLSFMIPLGISVGANVRIGTLLGAGQVDIAKRVARGAMMSSLVVMSVVSVAIYFGEPLIVQVFISDKSVIDIVRTVWLTVCITILTDGLFAVQAGILRALGLQLVFALIVLLCLWLTGLPFMYVLSKTMGYELRGVWIAMPIIYTLLNVFMFTAHALKNWQKVSDSIVLRHGGSESSKLDSATSASSYAEFDREPARTEMVELEADNDI